MLAHNVDLWFLRQKKVWGRVWALVGGWVKCCPAPPRAPLVAEREISLSCAHPAHNHSLIQSPILDQSVFIRWRTSPGAQPPKTPWWAPWILKVLLPRCFPKILRITSRRTYLLNRKAGCFFVYIYSTSFGVVFGTFGMCFGSHLESIRGKLLVFVHLLRTTPGAQPFLATFWRQVVSSLLAGGHIVPYSVPYGIIASHVVVYSAI